MLVHTLVDIAYKINNTWQGFDTDIKKLTSTLCKNMFPLKMIENIIGKFLCKKLEKTTPEVADVKIDTSYFKLPYIGKYSNNVQQNIKKLVNRYCKDAIKVKLVFNTCKVKNYFSQKDRIPSCFKSYVVYKFICARCNSCYVGRTQRHHSTRVNEHLVSDKKSHIYLYLKTNLECQNACDSNDFKTLIMLKQRMN